jgi:outer membrane protein assembly factor BamB
MSDERSPMNELEINDFWNELARPTGVSVVSANALDPAVAETIRRIHALGTSPPPASSRTRVQEQVRASVRQQAALGNQTLGQSFNNLTLPVTRPNGRVETIPGPSRLRFPAERRRWLVAQFATAALLAVTLLGIYLVFESRSQRAVPPPATPTSDVFFDRGNLARTGEMPGAGPNTKPALRWSYAEDARSTYSSATVADGTVFVRNVGRLVALYATTGTKRWEFPVQAEEGLYLAAPSVADGLVFVGSKDGVFAVDAESGTQRWVFSTERSVVASPLVVNGVVYIVTGGHISYPSNALFALNAETGTQLWTFDIGFADTPSLAYDGGVIYVSCVQGSHNVIFALDGATGEQRWMFEIPGLVVMLTPSVADGLVFTADEHAIYAIDAASGSERWRFSNGNDPFDPSPTQHEFAVANSVIYAANDVTGSLFALDAQSGTKLWEVSTVFGNQGAPVVAGAVVYLGTQRGILFALDTTDGHELWRQNTDSHILSSPTVSNGVVFFSDDGSVYALGDATEPSTTEE